MFQHEKILSAIDSDDLDLLESLSLSKYINQKFYLFKVNQNQVFKLNNSTYFLINNEITILIYAVLSNKPNVLDYLLRVPNIDLSIRIKGKSAIDFAIQNNSYECFNILFQLSYFQNFINSPIETELTKSKNDCFLTPLHLAVSANNEKIVYHLLKGPKNSYVLDKGNIVEVSVNYHIDIDRISPSGSTPLAIAVYKSESPLICKMLICKGADINKKGKKSPLDHLNENLVKYASIKDMYENVLKIKSLFELEKKDSYFYNMLFDSIENELFELGPINDKHFDLNIENNIDDKLNMFSDLLDTLIEEGYKNDVLKLLKEKNLLSEAEDASPEITGDSSVEI